MRCLRRIRYSWKRYLRLVRRPNTAAEDLEDKLW